MMLMVRNTWKLSIANTASIVENTKNIVSNTADVVNLQESISKYVVNNISNIEENTNNITALQSRNKIFKVMLLFRFYLLTDW